MEKSLYEKIRGKNVVNVEKASENLLYNYMKCEKRTVNMNFMENLKNTFKTHINFAIKNLINLYRFS